MSNSPYQKSVINLKTSLRHSQSIALKAFGGTPLSFGSKVGNFGSKVGKNLSSSVKGMGGALAAHFVDKCSEP